MLISFAHRVQVRVNSTYSSDTDSLSFDVREPIEYLELTLVSTPGIDRELQVSSAAVEFAK